MRLQKFLARAGVASRRGSEDLMSAGRVRVNGVVVTELGTKVDPLTDSVSVDGKPVSLSDTPVTLMLHKPCGYVTTMYDPQGRPTVAQLVPQDRYPGLFPVGRLDQDTSGLLLFSTDGELGHRLLHPSHHVDKTYRVLVRGKMTDDEIRQLKEGVQLEDILTAPAQVRILPQQPFDKDVERLELTIHEGRKRQVRRMCSAVGHQVVELERIKFGPLSLGDLGLGLWRELSQEELAALGRAVGL